jgi:hypothetical protein
MATAANPDAKPQESVSNKKTSESPVKKKNVKKSAVSPAKEASPPPAVTITPRGRSLSKKSTPPVDVTPTRISKRNQNKSPTATTASVSSNAKSVTRAPKVAAPVEPVITRRGKRAKTETATTEDEVIISPEKKAKTTTTPVKPAEKVETNDMILDPESVTFDEVDLQIKETEAALKELTGGWDAADPFDAEVDGKETPDEEKPLFVNLFDNKREREEGSSRAGSWKDVVTVTASGSSCVSPNLSPRNENQSSVDVSNSKEIVESEIVSESPAKEPEPDPEAVVPQVTPAPEPAADSQKDETATPAQEIEIRGEKSSPSATETIPAVSGRTENDVPMRTSPEINPEIDLLPNNDLYLELPEDRNQLMDGNMSCGSSVFSYPGSPTSSAAGGEYSCSRQCFAY